MPDQDSSESRIKAVLGPTNTGKTHLAIERMCGHSSGAMGFPLRLLAREVYDRVVRIKGESQVALITGEERIEPAQARYFLCTAEAMPREHGRHAFVALDEAQLGADRERGHIFTDHLLHTRGREETMLLGAATLEPLVRRLLPRAEIIERPRFSTLRHIGPRKLSRLPRRSAIVAFSAEQVYAMAEMLRRLRGGAAVVMGALSPQTRNRQVELFQSGEVDYIVATDAIGMGLNLDIAHVAFASLHKFDGIRLRRLLPSEMAQIAGRAGRHQQDGTFGTLAAGGAPGAAAAEFTDEEVYAIEEHRFAPLTQLYWREPEPRFDSIATLIADLEAKPAEPELQLAPDAVDLAVLRLLAAEPLADEVTTPGAVRRLWEVCSLPDFRQQGADTHARFVARLWQDLCNGYLGADYVAARIAELDNVQGDIHALQGRIAAIRSWAYIAQRPDWVLARDEMAARARAVEARLSDALHARLTERFVNRRTAVLMKSMGENAASLPVALGEDGVLTVDGEAIGRLEGFRFVIDPLATLADRKMLLAAGERALPGILGGRARWLAAEGTGELTLAAQTIAWGGHPLATLEPGASMNRPHLRPARDLGALAEADRTALISALGSWLETQLAPLAPLAGLETASRAPEAGSAARALLLKLIAGHGFVSREEAGLEHLPKDMRPMLRRLGIVFGSLDVFAPALLKPAPRRLLHELGLDPRPLDAAMPPVRAAARPLPAGYRPAGGQAVRIDIADKLVRSAHDARAKAAGRRFALDGALAISTGLTAESFRRLLGAAGFRCYPARPLPEGGYGPPAPDRWEWRPARARPDTVKRPSPPPSGGAFAALAELVGRG